MLRKHFSWGSPLLVLGLTVVPASKPADAGPINWGKVGAMGGVWGADGAAGVAIFGGSETGPPGWAAIAAGGGLGFLAGAASEAINEMMTNNPPSGGSVTVPTQNGPVQVQCGPNGQPGAVSFGPNGNVTSVQGCTVGPQADNSSTDPNTPQLAMNDSPTNEAGTDGSPSCGSGDVSCGSCAGSIQMAANCGAVGCGAGCGSCAAFG